MIMTKQIRLTSLHFIFFYLFLTLGSSLMIQNKPRHSRITPVPASVETTAAPNIDKTNNSSNNNNTDKDNVSSTAVTPGEGVSLYRLKNNADATCILMKTDAVIEIKFKSHIGDETGDDYIPDKPTVEGNCQHEDSATMTISWSEYVLFWEFAKTPGGERWYVNNIELTVGTALAAYHNVKTHGTHFKLVHNQMLFPTPVGKSYNCEESIVTLEAKYPEGRAQELKGTLFLRLFQLQPFMYKGAEFGQPFECNAQLGFRDETAPIAVGSTLAVAVLMTVTGYGIYRYFKIKKVQYNTME